MVRWEPGAADRMRIAAMELLREHGYEQTTVAEIAQRAGVTERTFYRHFSDKREVLFAGSEFLGERMIAVVRAAPAGTAPAGLVDAALDGLAESFPDDRREFARVRNEVLATEPALQEREQLKLTGLKTALGDLLAERGLQPMQARLLAETTIAVFHVSFATWIAQDERRSLAELQREALAQLRAVAG